MRPRTSYTRGMSTYRYPHTIENGAGERITFVRRVQDSAGDCVEVENVVKPGSGPHRLEAKDIALSRLKNAGGGTLGSPLFGGLFLGQKENRKRCSHRCAGERLEQGVRLDLHPRPDYEWQHEEEDTARRAEQHEPSSGGMSGDGAVGARFPEQCDPGDRRARDTHGKGKQSEVLWGIEQDQGRE